MLHHVPKNGNIVIAFGPHVGIDFDANVGKVNRRGHLGSGACCNTAIGAMAYVKAVKEGSIIDSPDPSDPCSAQQVFLNAELMKHSDRLLGSPNPDVELPHCIFDSADTLLKRILDKCLPADIQDGTKIALLGETKIFSFLFFNTFSCISSNSISFLCLTFRWHSGQFTRWYTRILSS